MTRYLVGAAMRGWLVTAVALGLLGALLARGAGPHASIEQAAVLRGLGLLLLAAGIALTLAGVRTGAPNTGRLRFFVLTSAAYVTFPMLANGVPTLGVPSLGMIVAVYVFAWVTASAMGGLSFSRMLRLASLAAACYLLLSLLLGWQVRVWPTFLV